MNLFSLSYDCNINAELTYRIMWEIHPQGVAYSFTLFNPELIRFPANILVIILTFLGQFLRLLTYKPPEQRHHCLHLLLILEITDVLLALFSISSHNSLVVTVISQINFIKWGDRNTAPK